MVINRFFFILIIVLSTGSEVAQSWTQISTTGAVPQLKNASAIYDPAANRIIVFGGRTPSGNSDEIWSLNLSNNQWNKILPTGTGPSARYTQNALYDSALYRMIIWSGQGAELYNDVWSLNLSDNSWLQLWPDGNVSGAPLKRYGTASVLDPLTRRLVTFAGFTTSGRFHDTWTFHIDSLSWNDRTTGSFPPMRCLHSACFADDLREMIVYGGQQTGALDDIWSLDLNSYQWSDITPSDKPPARFWNSTIYAGNSTIIIFGGLSGTTNFGDMWRFSLGNNSWSEVNQGSLKPSPRWGHIAVYIPSQDRMIIFGGEGTASYNDTWAFTDISAIGVKPISTKTPESFSLSQNYPNPFNPFTKIDFELPVKSFVELVVYNSLGQTIAQLVNEQLKQGTYTVDWNASGSPSGIYFYRITAGDYTETKKMILVK